MLLKKLTEVDVVTNYSFGRPDHRIEAENFDPSFHHVSFSAGTANVVMRHMNWILTITKAIPEQLAMRLSIEMSSFIVQRRVRRAYQYL